MVVVEAGDGPARCERALKAWRSKISSGARAAYQIAEWFPRLMVTNAPGEEPISIEGFTGADLMQADEDELLMLLDDLHDLKDQAEFSLEALVAVLESREIEY